MDIETVRYDNVPKMDEVCGKLQTYDMLVIGFGDCYVIPHAFSHVHHASESWCCGRAYRCV